MNETFLGVILGGVVALLGSVVGFFIQHKIENHKIKTEQRKKAYTNAIKWFSRLGTSDMEFLNDTYEVYEETRIGIYLYGSKKISMLFESANKNNAEKEDVEKFKAQVLKEIGYKN